MRRSYLAAVMLVLGATTPCQAQGIVPAGADSVFRHAQRLANDGNPAAGRALVDSMFAASAEGSPTYVEALYWRAMLAQSADEARHYYLRLAVEYPLSTRAEDALLRLAQMEMARGNRAEAKTLLNRLIEEHPNGASRAEAGYWMGRILLEEESLPDACAALADAARHVASSNVELANRISYYGRQCVTEQSADSARVAADSARADSVRAAAKAEARSRAERGPRWSVQVAAYAANADAERLVKRLTARGYDARVTGAKPYRVRIGRYAKRAEAVEVSRKLKAQKTSSIVVEAEKP